MGEEIGEYKKRNIRREIQEEKSGLLGLLFFLWGLMGE